VRAGDPGCPPGQAASRGAGVYVGDVAQAVLAALGTRRGAGQCLNADTGFAGDDDALAAAR
jgi:hypothetical protein